MLILAIGIGILFTPLFNISEIEINGNNKIKSDELIKKSGFILGENIFKFKLEDAGDNISEIPYVNSILVERVLPGKMRISITECIPMAYVKCKEKFVVIDKTGKTLEVKNNKNDIKIPILYDFELGGYTLGKKISVKDEEKLKKTLEITRDLYNNNLIEKVTSINSVSGKYYLNLDGNLKILIGDGENLNSKLVMINEVLKKLPKNASGTLDATDSNKVYHRTE